MPRPTARKFVVHVPWRTELRGGNQLCDLAGAIEDARRRGVPEDAQVTARNALTGGAMLRLTFAWQESATAAPTGPKRVEPTPHVCQFCETPLRDHWWDPCTYTSQTGPDA